MSRYTALHKATGRQIAWGYDNPLGEYFFTEFWNSKESVLIEQALDLDPSATAKLIGHLPGFDSKLGLNEEVVFSIMNHTTTWPHPKHPETIEYTNSDILELMKNYPEIPQEHKDAIAFDIPF